MALSGNQKTRIGASVSGVGTKLSIIAKSPGGITGRILKLVGVGGGLVGPSGVIRRVT